MNHKQKKISPLEVGACIAATLDLYMGSGWTTVWRYLGGPEQLYGWKA